MFSRRRFLSRAGAVSASAAVFPHIGRSAEALAAATGQKPRHIIHLVVDGMSMGTLTCADYFSHLVRNRGLTFMELFNTPGVRSGWMNMRSLNSMVTDSSAASSSWGSGSRIINGWVNVLPDGTPLKTLYELFGAQGWKRGLVTTTEITHATPAGFAGCVDNRDTGSMIAVQYLERKIDVLLGGGQKFFDPATRRDKRNLREDYKTAGYHVMETADELAAASTDVPWLGIFSSSHLPYLIDQMSNEQLRAKTPTLAAMTSAALKWLERHDHFILQVEGGRVDHACHNCDAPAALREMIGFDEALDVVLAFQKKHPDTLVVLTTDHGNGNMGSNGTGSAYGQSSWMFRHTAAVKNSFPEIIRQLKRRPVAEESDEKKEDADAEGFNARQDASSASASEAASATNKSTLVTNVAAATNLVSATNALVAGTNALSSTNATGRGGRYGSRRGRGRSYIPTPAEAMEIIYACTGYKPSERRAALLIPYLQRQGSPIYDLMNNEMVQLGQLIGNRIGIGWTGNAHTADFVPVLSWGPGAERFAGFIQNVDVFRHYTQLAGIDFKNPTEDLIAGMGRDAHDVENIDEYA